MKKEEQSTSDQNKKKKTTSGKSVEVVKPAHKIRFKKEPIWLKCNFVGKYEGIKFRFTYHEYNTEDASEVIKKFNFAWPGKVPEDKKFAEKGIQTLFLKLKNAKDSSVTMKVIKDADNVLLSPDQETQEEVDNIVAEELQEEPEEIIKEIHEAV